MILNSYKLKVLLNELREGKIVEKKDGKFWQRKVYQENIPLDDALDYIEYYMDMGFLKFRIEETEPLTNELCEDIVKKMLLDEIEDLDMTDPCGAPWIRVKLRHLKAVYNKMDKWWKG